MNASESVWPFKASDLSIGGVTFRWQPPELQVVLDGSVRASLRPLLEWSDHVEYWSDGTGALLVGEQGRDLIYVDPGSATAWIVAQLDRLNLDGEYDPGGLHHVVFLPVNASVIIKHEIGVARVTRTGFLVWQRRFDDLGVSIETIDGDTMTLRNEERYSIRLSDGARLPADLNSAG